MICFNNFTYRYIVLQIQLANVLLALFLYSPHFQPVTIARVHFPKKLNIFIFNSWLVLSNYVSFMGNKNLQYACNSNLYIIIGLSIWPAAWLTWVV